MSEKILEGFGKIEEMTPEKILSQLLKVSKVDMHTEIKSPLNITALEVISRFLKGKDFSYSHKILNLWLKRFKINMVAYERKRALELVDAYKSRSETEGRSLKQLLLGK